MDYEIKLSTQDLQTIVSALVELPLKVSGGVYSRIQSQVVLQDAKSAADPKDLPAQ